MIDFSPYELWSQLYPQLHLALVEAKNADNKVNIGFSFFLNTAFIKMKVLDL